MVIPKNQRKNKSQIIKDVCTNCGKMKEITPVKRMSLSGKVTTIKLCSKCIRKVI